MPKIIPAIIDPGFAAHIGRKLWLKPRKLFRRQPKIMPLIIDFPSETLNHEPTRLRIPSMGPGQKAMDST